MSSPNFFVAVDSTSKCNTVKQKKLEIVSHFRQKNAHSHSYFSASFFTASQLERLVRHTPAFVFVHCFVI